MRPGHGDVMLGAVADVGGFGLKAHGKYRFEETPWLYVFGEAEGRTDWAGRVSGSALLGLGGNF